MQVRIQQALALLYRSGGPSLQGTIGMLELCTLFANSAALASAVPLYATRFNEGAHCWNSCSQLAIKEEGTTIMNGSDDWPFSIR